MLNVYTEGDKALPGAIWKTPQSLSRPNSPLNSGASGHNGSDFYATHFFIQKISAVLRA